jgi:hypothetical protein
LVALHSFAATVHTTAPPCVSFGGSRYARNQSSNIIPHAGQYCQLIASPSLLIILGLLDVHAVHRAMTVRTSFRRALHGLLRNSIPLKINRTKDNAPVSGIFASTVTFSRERNSDRVF